MRAVRCLSKHEFGFKGFSEAITGNLKKKIDKRQN